ncbi:MAG: hypothetical protein HN828_00815 [Candidatus Thioglobus sp.]|jgi:hypothetical protein|uniref:hypothetical protein n=1 Tax=Candidatus Thioglobus sp. TaxID=2026721 RepID=UPI001DE81691|nr:hypothetical protein [Candidatus Thioglobus sp.]MBT3186532.1 hypothetical protein [Candidatus Thioglobus sp.]MBT3431234.1 hypothetical protein [Candidatus Thioglobus sp.]MBT4316251.1 hypothetical protein [Candidatus Thioglobus sp.]MBT4552927.1 hypothetical protein [Candidatus Thioglobus sp.]MBT4923718.1 hypothetical protein [Candidatus Thioglobus sp.]
MIEQKKALESLRRSVNKALAIKKALGHYAVVWDRENKKVVRIEAKDLPEYKYKSENS